MQQVSEQDFQTIQANITRNNPAAVASNLMRLGVIPAGSAPSYEEMNTAVANWVKGKSKRELLAFVGQVYGVPVIPTEPFSSNYLLTLTQSTGQAPVETMKAILNQKAVDTTTGNGGEDVFSRRLTWGQWALVAVSVTLIGALIWYAVKGIRASRHQS